MFNGFEWLAGCRLVKELWGPFLSHNVTCLNFVDEPLFFLLLYVIRKKTYICRSLEVQ